jgi:CLIP-associating protein 1/2
MLALVQIRRTQHLFPIRPYLPLLITALEDTDSNVRDCARQSVVELFTGPGVSDAARADLKKEMTKKNVRKQIAETVLQRVLSGSTGGGDSVPQSESSSETGVDERSSKKEYVPPSMRLAGLSNGKPAGTTSNTPTPMGRTVSQSAMGSGSRPQSRAAIVTSGATTPTAEVVAASSSSDVPIVYVRIRISWMNDMLLIFSQVASSKDLETEFADMLKAFDGKETEHNWAPRERAIVRIRGMLKGEVHVRFGETFFANLKSILDASAKTVRSFVL